jgi:hypothetical protein
LFPYSDGVLKLLEFRLQAVATGRLSMLRRLKPELQRPAAGFQAASQTVTVFGGGVLH